MLSGLPPLQVFLSFAAKDTPIAEKLKRALEGYGLTVTTGLDLLRPGDLYAARIFEAISSSDWFLILISKSSDHNRELEIEFSSAIYEQSEGKVRGIIPVLVDRHAQVPPMLAPYAALDLSRGFDDSTIEQIVRAISHPVSQPSFKTALKAARDTHFALVLEKSRNAPAKLSRLLVIGGVTFAVIIVFRFSLVFLINTRDSSSPNWHTVSSLLDLFSSTFAPILAFVLGYYFGGHTSTSGRISDSVEPYSLANRDIDG